MCQQIKDSITLAVVTMGDFKAIAMTYVVCDTWLRRLHIVAEAAFNAAEKLLAPRLAESRQRQQIAYARQTYGIVLLPLSSTIRDTDQETLPLHVAVSEPEDSRLNATVAQGIQALDQENLIPNTVAYTPSFNILNLAYHPRSITLWPDGSTASIQSGSRGDTEDRDQSNINSGHRYLTQHRWYLPNPSLWEAKARQFWQITESRLRMRATVFDHTRGITGLVPGTTFSSLDILIMQCLIVEPDEYLRDCLRDFVLAWGKEQMHREMRDMDRRHAVTGTACRYDQFALPAPRFFVVVQCLLQLEWEPSARSREWLVAQRARELQYIDRCHGLECPVRKSFFGSCHMLFSLEHGSLGGTRPVSGYYEPAQSEDEWNEDYDDDTTVVETDDDSPVSGYRSPEEDSADIDEGNNDELDM
jgi:hypothetical protein